MQIATLNYDHASKENRSNDIRTNQVPQHRHVLTSVTQNQRKHRHRQSFISELAINGSAPLPPIVDQKRSSKSMRITGSSLAATKITETLTRSRSRDSLLSETSQRRNSRSISPGGTVGPSSRFVSLKFGHPVKFRSTEFYNSRKGEENVRSREAAFVNDSIRSAHQSRRQSIIPPYEPLADPHLKHFFQSPIVLDIVRKTLSHEQSTSFKSDDRLSNLSRRKHRAKTTDSNDYRRIVTKGSSGYGKLNGYDCIPPSSPARQNARRSSVLDGSVSNLTHYTSNDSRLNHLSQIDKARTSTNTSVNSFPTHSSNNQNSAQNKKKSLRRQERIRPPQPVATSSPLRNPLRQLTEETTTARSEAAQENSSTNENLTQQTNHDENLQSAQSQD